MKAIIYCRKSTDRSDRQQLSISAQEQEARKIAEREWLEVVHVFKETKSAKEPGRPCFNEMMSMFASSKADCIITWKLNRLARNPVDEWTVKWSIQNGIIKAIYTDWEVFKTWDNVLIMWMHFWMSTQYILDLQKDIKRWMKKKIENWWVCQKAPIWYINNRLEKTIEIDPIKSQRVKYIFELRAQKMAFSTIRDMMYKKWYTIKNNKPFPVTTLETIIKNKFYIWLVKFNGTYYKWKYKQFISHSLFEKANDTGRWLHQYTNIWIQYPLKWLIKDSDGKTLSAYKQKWHIYYKSPTKSSVAININQNKLFEKISELLKPYKIQWEFKELNKKMALKILEQLQPDIISKKNAIKSKITKLENKKQNLLDLRLEWEIDKKLYDEKLNHIIFEINHLESEKSKLSTKKDEQLISKSVELGCDLYKSYNQWTQDSKPGWLKNVGVELFINTKKELSIVDNPFLNLINFCNFQNGGAKRVRTAVNGVADRCITTLPWHQIFIA